MRLYYRIIHLYIASYKSLKSVYMHVQCICIEISKFRLFSWPDETLNIRHFNIGDDDWESKCLMLNLHIYTNKIAIETH